jgi:hypothetical protein
VADTPIQSGSKYYEIDQPLCLDPRAVHTSLDHSIDDRGQGGDPAVQVSRNDQIVIPSLRQYVAEQVREGRCRRVGAAVAGRVPVYPGMGGVVEGAAGF